MVQSERQIRTKIINYLKKKKWFMMPLSDQWVSGYPDLLIIKNGTHIFLEIKKEEGIVSKIQQYFIDDINGNGGFAAIVRSVDDVKTIIGEKTL